MIAAEVSEADALCEVCHDAVAATWPTTVHGRIAEHETHGFGVGCTTCHGDGAAHAESGDPELIRGLGEETLIEEVSVVCLECHRSEGLHDWDGSTHELHDVGCIDCHSPHTPITELAQDPQLCWDCHRDVQAQFQYPSHHPLREGHMNCSSCHTPHGGSIGLLVNEERPQELCLDCHSALAGPWVFEHEPVAEGCDTCHEPHGAVANNLLTQNEPFLCLQCHEMHFHAGLAGEEDLEVYIPRYDPANGATDTVNTYPGGLVPNPFGVDSYKRAFTSNCSQCHRAVHGSDLPSQTVTSQGGGLTR